MGGQLLWGTVNLNTVISSADGGATWRPGYSPERYNQLDSIDSADPQTLALVPAGDDDSKQPGTLYRSTDGGATWATLHPAQFHDSGAGWAAVLPDGRLLITVMTPFGSLSAKPELYESDSTSWLSFHRVGGSSPLPNGWLILTTVDAGGHGSLWLDGGDRFSISTDEGRAWHVTPMR